MKQYGRLLLSLVAVAALASQVSAQITTFFGNDQPRGTFTNSSTADASFLGSFVVTGTDNLDSYTPFATASLSFGGATAATSTTPATSFVIADSFLPGTWSISSANLLVDAGSPGTRVFTISRPVNGFGLYVVNAGDAVANQFSFELFSSQTNVTKVIPVNGSGNGTGSPDVIGPGRDPDSVFFFGVSDTDAFDRVTILAQFDGTQDGLLFDNVSIGFISAVPEPTTYALIGLVGVVGYGRYRYIKRQQRKNEGR